MYALYNLIAMGLVRRYRHEDGTRYALMEYYERAKYRKRMMEFIEQTKDTAQLSKEEELEIEFHLGRGIAYAFTEFIELLLVKPRFELPEDINKMTLLSTTIPLKEKLETIT